MCHRLALLSWVANSALIRRRILLRLIWVYIICRGMSGPVLRIVKIYNNTQIFNVFIQVCLFVSIFFVVANINPYPAFTTTSTCTFSNSIDPDQMVSSEAIWSGSTLFVIQFENLNKNIKWCNLIGWWSEMGVANYIIQQDKGCYNRPTWYVALTFTFKILRNMPIVHLRHIKYENFVFHVRQLFTHLTM